MAVVLFCAVVLCTRDREKCTERRDEAGRVVVVVVAASYAAAVAAVLGCFVSLHISFASFLVFFVDL